MSNLALSLEMKPFMNLCMRFSPERAVMVRGRPGIGKSQSVYQVAEKLRSDVYKSEGACATMSGQMHAEASFRKAIKRFWKRHGSEAKYEGYDRKCWHYDMGIPVVERRLSQLSEGDIIGLPFDGGIGTIFKPTEWLILTSIWPCVLFLDELNRAVKGVEQATFQIADSKAFYGHLLHDESRVFVACNIGDQFDVTPMDPAAISRYAMIDLEPSVEDWIEWARENCHPALMEFIRANPRLLEHKEEFEPNRKYPDRRAWANLDHELTFADLYTNCNERVFLDMAASMVGFSAASTFWDYVKSREIDISATDILDKWTSVKSRLPGRDSEKYNSKMLELAGKLCDALLKAELSKEQAKNVAQFMRDIPAEPTMSVWQALNRSRKNFVRVAPLVDDLMVRLVSAQDKPTPAAPAATGKTAKKK